MPMPVRGLSALDLMAARRSLEDENADDDEDDDRLPPPPPPDEEPPPPPPPLPNFSDEATLKRRLKKLARWPALTARSGHGQPLAPIVEREGKLRVVVRRAHGLRPADLDGKPDPYVILICGRKSHRTRFLSLRTIDPVWNESCEFTGALADLQRSGLTLRVLDRDLFSTHELLGEVTCSLAELGSKKHYVEYVEPLRLVQHGLRGAHGTLFFSAEFQPALGPAHQVGSPLSLPRDLRWIRVATDMRL